jgi:hypothetical protein
MWKMKCLVLHQQEGNKWCFSSHVHLNAFSILSMLLGQGTGVNLMFNYGFLLLILFGISLGASDSCTFHSLFTSGADLEAFAATSIL